MNIFGIENSSKLIEKQAFLKNLELVLSLDHNVTEEEFIMAVSNGIQEFYEQVGKPLFKPIYPNQGGLPIVEHYNKNNNSIYNDIVVISSEIKELAENLVDHFNYRQTQNSSIKNKINYLSSLCYDYVLTSNTEDNNIHYVKETFNSYDNISTITVADAKAYIDPKLGVLTLRRTSSQDNSASATVASVSGNGSKGNYKLVKVENNVASFISSNGANDIEAVMLDGNPDTVFEYQNIYDTAISNNLYLTVLIELKEIEDVNWINVNPYIPISGQKVKVKGIRTSVDGTSWKELYNEALTLHSEINATAQTYRAEDIISNSTPSDFKGQGVWSFDSRPTKFVEIVFETGQDNYYKAWLGKYRYLEVTTDNNTSITVERSESEVSSSIKTADVGKHYISNNKYISKDIVYYEGYRYSIGIKDIGVHSYIYAPRSEVITVPYTFTDNIKEVALYAEEYIPESFLTNFKKFNSWITYEISLDGNTFYPISPMHRNAVGAGEIQTASGESIAFPPKIYTINPQSYDVQQDIFYKGYIGSLDNPVKNPHSIQLKITINRPDDIADTTPIVDSFTLKIRTEAVE